MSFAVPQADDPAELFGLLWPLIEPHIGAITSEPWVPTRAPEYGLITGLLNDHMEPELPHVVREYLAGKQRAGWEIPPEALAKRAFLIMRALDRSARLIMPESIEVATRSVLRKPGHMLQRLRDRWMIDGALADTAHGHVVIKGPLTRGQRAEEPEIANGDNLRDQFQHLTFVARPGAGRRLRFRTISPSNFYTSEEALKRVGTAPIAEDAHDLEFTPVDREGVCFLDARPSDSAVVADRAAAVVLGLVADGADLVVLPELVMCPAATAAVSKALGDARSATRGLVVLGSGLSDETADGTTLQYNEAIILDSRGIELFRQRKLHHYSMDPDRMKSCGISMARPVAHREDAAAGEVLEIRDIPGVGRFIVLICEDLAQDEPGRNVAVAIRPDWIVTPVLDLSQRSGRWTHRRAHYLETGSRIVVAGSGTLSVRHNRATKYAELPATEGIALFFDGTAKNAVHIVERGSEVRDARYVVDWRPENWPITAVIATAHPAP